MAMATAGELPQANSNKISIIFSAHPTHSIQAPFPNNHDSPTEIAEALNCEEFKRTSLQSRLSIAADALDPLYEKLWQLMMELVTLVLQDADKLDLYLLSQKWNELVEKARANSNPPQEYNFGTSTDLNWYAGAFTLSNLGMFGVDIFDGILPPGQEAILAGGASKPTVITDKEGFFSVKNQMLLTIESSIGSDLASCLQIFSNTIENPESLNNVDGHLICYEVL